MEYNLFCFLDQDFETEQHMTNNIMAIHNILPDPYPSELNKEDIIGYLHKYRNYFENTPLIDFFIDVRKYNPIDDISSRMVLSNVYLCAVILTLRNSKPLCPLVFMASDFYKYEDQEILLKCFYDNLFKLETNSSRLGLTEDKCVLLKDLSSKKWLRICNLLEEQNKNISYLIPKYFIKFYDNIDNKLQLCILEDNIRNIFKGSDIKLTMNLQKLQEKCEIWRYKESEIGYLV